MIFTYYIVSIRITRLFLFPFSNQDKIFFSRGGCKFVFHSFVAGPDSSISFFCFVRVKQKNLQLPNVAVSFQVVDNDRYDNNFLRNVSLQKGRHARWLLCKDRLISYCAHRTKMRKLEGWCTIFYNNLFASSRPFGVLQ